MQGAFRYFIPLLLLTTTAEARLAPKPGASSVVRPAGDGKERRRYDCSVEQKLKNGTISLTRLFTDQGVFDAGDFMRWNPQGYDPQHPQRPIDLELSYIWDPAKQSAVEPRAIELKVRVGLDVDLPEVALIQMQRPFPVEPYGVIGSTALSTQIFPFGSYDLKNGHGEIPLGDLLAYAEGYRALDWSLVQPSDRLGGDKELARGTIDIDAMREALSALPQLREALVAKAVKPKTQCRQVSWPDITVY